MKQQHLLSLITTTILFVLTAPPTKADLGYALSFNGSNSYVEINRPVSGDFTLAFWFLSTQVAGNDMQWYEGRGMLDGFVSPPENDFGVALGAGKVVYGTGTSTLGTDSAGRDYSISSDFVADGNWHHVAATRVQASGLIRLYVDGLLVASTTAHTNLLNAPAKLRLGGLANGTGFFKGQLDEVQIWNRALTLSEVQSIMAQTPNTTNTSLVAYLPFIEGNRLGTPATITADVSGHGYHGTLVHRPTCVQSTRPQALTLQLLGNKLITNVCQTSFTDPGAVVLGTPISLAAGGYHSLALKANGSVVGWGDNTSGQTTTPTSATNVIAIAEGGFDQIILTPICHPEHRNHSLALKADGSLVSWGDNSCGQTAAPSSATNVIAIAAGSYHSLALKADGSVVGWGDNSYGQINVPSSTTNVIAIAAGSYHSLALKADGSVAGWGDNSLGPTTVPSSATNVVAIAAGSYHSLALKADGSVVGWGENSYGWINVPSSATNVIAIAAGSYHSLALKADGSVVGWGDNSYGQINVPSSATNVIAIAAGSYHSLALKADGSVVGWGDNSHGQTTATPNVSYLKNTAVSGTVDISTPGIYQLIYSATNNFHFLTTNRTVVIIDAPYLSNLEAWVVSTNPSTGMRAATFNASISPNGLDTTAYLQFGTSTNYPVGSPVVTLPAGFSGSNLVVLLDGLAPGITEHWRVVASNSLGRIVGMNHVLAIPAAQAGDTDGDGVVSASEAAVVMQHYWTSTSNYLTSLTSLRQGAFTFGLTNSPGLCFSVLASTNLQDWVVLTNAAPEFLFNDPEATNYHQRFYRLRWP